jgi:replication-associated recombination protein RarA
MSVKDLRRFRYGLVRYRNEDIETILLIDEVLRNKVEQEGLIKKQEEL